MVWIFLQGHGAARPGSAAGAASCRRSALYRRTRIRNTPNRCASRDASALRAFCGRDQLQKFLRIIQPLFEFRAQRLCRNLCRHADFAGIRSRRRQLSQCTRGADGGPR